MASALVLGERMMLVVALGYVSVEMLVRVVGIILGLVDDGVTVLGRTVDRI